MPSGSDTQALGRSRGGFGTKIRVCVDALGRPVRILLGPGHENDMAPACGLIDGVAAEHVMAYDADLYRERNHVERFLIKHFRRIATRYNKLASTFKGFIRLAAITLWLK
jgi:transposase